MTTTQPANGARLSSPFEIDASARTCKGQAVSAMGYSLDDSTATTIEPASFTTLALAGDGEHTLHIKCWGTSGAADVQNISITVSTPNDPPQNVYAVSNIQTLSGWVGNHDPGTSGTSSGTTQLVTSPTLSGTAREFTAAYTDSGGEIFHASFADDTAATHFIYNADIYAADLADIANVEMDMNQVLSDGTTVIYGFQCDGYSGTWDYTLNTGSSPTAYKDSWIHSNVTCPKPSTWTPNAWHHIQVEYERDAAGNVTYDALVFDGVEYYLSGATGSSDFALGWGKVLLTNFQLDGSGSSGAARVYVDNMTVYKW